MIFYFSGTGNSEYAARRIAESTGDQTISIAECSRSERFSFAPDAGERVGFVFPVYFYGVPAIVLDFIGRLELTSAPGYTFAVCTSGGDPAGANKMLRRALARRSMRLDAAFELSMPDNYIILFDLLTPPDKAARLLAEAEGGIAEIAAAVMAAGPVAPRSGPGRWLKTAAAYPLYNRSRGTGKFYALVDCNGCGLCERLCPCGVIEMRDRRPEWREGKCTQCLACLHRCPKRAVQYGRKTLARGRYVNPNVK